MKTTVYYISLIALLGTGLVACSRLEKEVLPADDVVMQIATVGFGNPATRALTDGGVKTFAPNDKIAVFYTNTSDEVVKVESAPLRAACISADGKSAGFDVALTNPKPGGYLNYIYPAAIAGATANSPDMDKLCNQQDGTLETISSTMDYASYVGTLSQDGKLPESATLENPLAICKFQTIQDIYTNAPLNAKITKLRITVGLPEYTYHINRTPANGSIYVAMLPVSNNTVHIWATDGTNQYWNEFTDKTLEANHFYTVTTRLEFCKASFEYTGARQTFTVPRTGWYDITAYGAAGGKAYQNLSGGTEQKAGGIGGKSEITYHFEEGTTLSIYCGGAGGNASRVADGGGAAGWNGGGAGGNGYQDGYTGGGGGGGATYIATSDLGVISSTNSLFTGEWSSPTAKSGLILVAGGGGGAAYNSCTAGAGGGSSYTLGTRASDNQISDDYKKDTTHLTISGSLGGPGNKGYDNKSNQRGGSGGHGGGFIALYSLNEQVQTYAGAGGSSWGHENGLSYQSTLGGGTTDDGNGFVNISWVGTYLK